LPNAGEKISRPIILLSFFSYFFLFFLFVNYQGCRSPLGLETPGRTEGMNIPIAIA
jgi:hypothetical protein